MLRIKLDYCIKILQISEFIKRKTKRSSVVNEDNNTTTPQKDKNTKPENIPLVQLKTSVNNKQESHTIKMNKIIGKQKYHPFDDKKQKLFISDILFKQKVNNIVVIYWQENKMFTTNIDLRPGSTSSKKASSARLDKVNCRSDENVVIMRNAHSDIRSIKLEDKESLYMKLERWLIGINWNELQRVDKKSILDQIDALREQVQSL